MVHGCDESNKLARFTYAMKLVLCTAIYPEAYKGIKFNMSEINTLNMHKLTLLHLLCHNFIRDCNNNYYCNDTVKLVDTKTNINLQVGDEQTTLQLTSRYSLNQSED